MKYLKLEECVKICEDIIDNSYTYKDVFLKYGLYNSEISNIINKKIKIKRPDIYNELKLINNKYRNDPKLCISVAKEYICNESKRLTSKQFRISVSTIEYMIYKRLKKVDLDLYNEIISKQL